MSKIKITDEMVEAGVDGFLDACDLDANTEDLVRGVLRAVVPLIAAAEREACEKIANAAVAAAMTYGRGDMAFGAKMVEEAIRERSS